MHTRLTDFQSAADSFAAKRTADYLVTLMSAATALVNTDPAEDENDDPALRWISLREAGDFYRVRLTFMQALTDDQIIQASKCLGYALACTVIGDGLSEPMNVTPPNDARLCTVLDYGYDSTKSIRDDWHNDEAEELARDYIQNGSPVRKSDRAGEGTKGTRKCEGIGIEPALIEVDSCD